MLNTEYRQLRVDMLVEVVVVLEAPAVEILLYASFVFICFIMVF